MRTAHVGTAAAGDRRPTLRRPVWLAAVAAGVPIGALAVSAQPVGAATQTINSGATGNLTSTSIYTSPNTVPSNGDNINVDGAFNVSYGSGDTAVTSLGTVSLNPNSGAGVFNQTAGPLTIASLILGGGGGSRFPQYNVSGATLNLGALSFGNGDARAIPTGTTLNALAGSTVNFTGAGNVNLGPTPGATSTISLSNSTFNDAAATYFYLGNSGAASGAGTLTLTGASVFNASSATLVLGQQASAAFVQGTVNLSGTSTLTVSSVNYGGLNTINPQAGVFNLNGGTLTAATVLRGDSSTAPSATLNVFNASGGTVVASAANPAYFNGLYLNVAAGGLTFNTGGNAVGFTPATLTGAGAVTKLGAGTLAVAVNDTHTGGTAINAGTFQANTTGAGNSSTGTAASAVTIASGAVLAGGTKAAPGRIAGSVSVPNGATITAGTGLATAASPAIGTLVTTGTDDFDSGGTYLVKVNAGNVTGTAAAPVAGDAAGDLLTLSGLTFNGNATATTGTTPFVVTLASLGTTNFAAGSELVIATQPSSTALSFASLITAGDLTLSTGSGTVTVGGNPLTLGDEVVNSLDELVITSAAPEPTSLVLAGAAGAPLVLARRRRRAATIPVTVV